MKRKPDAGKEKHDRGQDKQHLDQDLEEGLRETFPASDAPAATQPVHKPLPKR